MSGKVALTTTTTNYDDETNNNHRVVTQVNKIEKIEEETKQPNPEKQTKTTPKKTVFFIIPFAVPGSGKSFCWNIIRKFIDS